MSNWSAAFWMSCRGQTAHAGTPAKTELQCSRYRMNRAWTRTCASSWVRNGRILLMLWRINLQEQVVAAMLATKDFWSSSVTLRFLAVQPASFNGNGEVIDGRCRPLGEEQHSHIYIYIYIYIFFFLIYMCTHIVYSIRPHELIFLIFCQ